MEERIRRGRPTINLRVVCAAAVCLLLAAAGALMLRASKRPAAAVAAQTAVHAADAAPSDAPQPQGAAPARLADVLAQLARRPDDAELLAAAGNLYYDARDLRHAIPYYERSARVKPAAGVLTDLANAYHYAGRDELAMATLQRALAADPGWADALFNLGLLKWQSQGDPITAVELWQKLLAANPEHPKREEVKRLIAQASRHIGVFAGAGFSPRVAPPAGERQ